MPDEVELEQAGLQWRDCADMHLACGVQGRGEAKMRVMLLLSACIVSGTESEGEGEGGSESESGKKNARSM